MRPNLGPIVASALILSLVTLPGCAALRGDTERTTVRDKTRKGAAIGAAAGAVLGAVLGEGEADEILAGAAIGAGIGAGVGSYMDRQEEKLARIPGTTVERVSDDMLLVHFDADLLFPVNSSTLGRGSRQSLEQTSQVLHEFRKTALIAQGHTDSTGSASYNLSLSERRAHAVTNFMLGRGIDRTRMVAVGYGESEPVADNGTEAGRRQNRRVDLLLKAKAR